VLLDDRTLGGSANEDLDLQALLDANGQALAAVEVVGLVFKADPANTSAIHVLPGLATPWLAWLQAGSVMVLAPGAVVALGSTADGAYPVTGGAKSINVDNQDAGNGSYSIWALTRSA